ncbi:class I SAM-dependent DNA methyltransferase [Cytobacillus massiliigabonensis]|uniref:class I SAM-dependent DNA methyltransferase n=1 Tax=Cytobacillus massiliigabonensis TaxID=1871011 RepID=UPI000C85B011|nr:class I SAM-dependent methyltransferase [Cytobacillus massiliigabonensis]
MNTNGSQYYDNQEFFNKYTLKRASNENPNDTIEKPIFMELMGNVSQFNVLDLGCGDGRIGADLINFGCSSYHGIEGSTNMYNLASSNLESFKNVHLVRSTIEDWTFPKGHFDLVISRLVLHYINDIEAIFEKIYHSLTDGGKFIFSIEHPVITSTLQKSGKRTNWIVDNYFIRGIREQLWLGANVCKHHRTIEDYFHHLKSVGFNIESIKESEPKKENFQNEETFKRRLRIPLFLFFSSAK